MAGEGDSRDDRRYAPPTELIDSDHRPSRIRNRHGRGGDDRAQAVALYYAVRDGFRYDPYRIDLSPHGMKASTVLDNGYGWCVPRPRCSPPPAAPSASLPGWVRRRAQPPLHRAHASGDADRHLLLARLCRHPARRHVAQGDTCVQCRTLRAFRPPATRIRRDADSLYHPFDRTATATWST